MSLTAKEAAIEYAKRGWGVIATSPGAKVPVSDLKYSAEWIEVVVKRPGTYRKAVHPLSQGWSSHCHR